MPYMVLTDPPVRCVYKVTGCSTAGGGYDKIHAIKAVRQMVMRDGVDQDHPLYGLKEARDFVEAIMGMLNVSTLLIIEMEPGDSWRHRAIIGAVLATLGVSYDKIETR